MGHFVYIIYSESIDKYYVGKTKSVQNRLKFHNSKLNKIWTKKGKPWILKTSFEFENSNLSSFAERFIKRQKSKIFIEKIINEGWKG